jgi:hypothetical protein
MTSIISRVGDFNAIPLDSVCLLLAEGRPQAQHFMRLQWRKQTLKTDKSATINDPTETLMPFLNFSRSGLLIRLHARVVMCGQVDYSFNKLISEVICLSPRPASAP